ncbi:hypothetical protein NDI52_32430 [Leptolyngbya sp. PL-A3]|uniref:hypothetical protein n=1 Tax=Leptolyngbya sp. PL-A3 TaxID=2933911 RepID=UPI0032994413
MDHLHLNLDELTLLASALLGYYQACKEVHGHGSKTLAVSALVKKVQHKIDFEKQAESDRFNR